ncbi:conserved hypothetical protein [Pyrobaculum islandicum DSM 4184]|uniref:Uncharacterized protein n=1 Tax=Pyrobaculum islandicum (strain DSM 4184 / JCM 9189 / GEO3) TaxID=384616 RepID=A1RSP8_PYRIL|nr:hypothetical protein [Pyrobaculum islandicum]ABL87980.1 conserved hypothetical protein [Pyrobaculum islandicum DSM 4184]
MKELEKVVDLAKRAGMGSVKYVKWSYSLASDTYHVKIYLVKPLEWRILSEIIKEVERVFSVKIYVPHARVLRLDLRKK